MQVIILHCFSNSFVQKSHSTISRLLLCYKQFPIDTPKSAKVSVLCGFVQQFVLNLSTKIVIQWQLEKQIKKQIVSQNFWKTSQFDKKNDTRHFLNPVF